MTRPARDYKWADAEPGNTLALKHGAYSTRVVEPRARAILAHVTVTAPAWLELVDSAALDAWATAEARCAVLREWCDEHGLIDSKGKATHAADLLLRSERLAADLRARLGFDPLSRARLGRDSAIAVAAAESAVSRVAEVGRAIRKARELTSDGVDHE